MRIFWPLYFPNVVLSKNFLTKFFYLLLLNWCFTEIEQEQIREDPDPDVAGTVETVDGVVKSLGLGPFDRYRSDERHVCYGFGRPDDQDLGPGQGLRRGVGRVEADVDRAHLPRPRVGLFRTTPVPVQLCGR